jgi:hypothetical protein
MKTDEPIYTPLSTGAEAFRVLTGGLRLTGPYQFRSGCSNVSNPCQSRRS